MRPPNALVAVRRGGAQSYAIIAALYGRIVPPMLRSGMAYYERGALTTAYFCNAFLLRVHEANLRPIAAESMETLKSCLKNK